MSLILDKFLKMLSPQDQMPQDAAEYILSLRGLILNFDITDRVADLPLEMSRAEVTDRFWLCRMQSLICDHDAKDMNFRQWWRKQRILRHFGDLKELSEKEVLELNLADDLVMLFANFREIGLKYNRHISHEMDVYEWYELERQRIFDRTKKDKNSAIMRELSERFGEFHESCRKLSMLYMSVYTALRDLMTKNFLGTVFRDSEAKEEFLYSRHEYLTKCAKLRARISPRRLLAVGSYPHMAQNILRNLETGTTEHSARHLLEKDIAKTYQRLLAAVEVANGRDD